MKGVQEKTFALKNWAVVGAKADHNSFGYKIFRLLKERGYNVYPVNPNCQEIDGDKCYASIKDLPEKIEVVDMVVNPYVGIHVMKEIKELGVNYVWMQPGTRSDAIKDFARENDITLIEDCVLIRLA